MKKSKQERVLKQYWKMAGVFREVVQPERFNYAMANPKATYAAHAINSHDELVQMNQELLAALEQVVGDVRTLADHSYGVYGLHNNGDLAPWGSLFAGGFFESWLLSVDDAESVIDKVKGGEA